MDTHKNQEAETNVGKLTFTETITLFKEQPKDLGWKDTIIFFNQGEDFKYEAPSTELVDPRSGVICLPNNYAYPNDENLEYGILRITALAHNQQWFSLAEPAYQKAKQDWYTTLQKTALGILPGLKETQAEFAARTIAKDMFTPERFINSQVTLMVLFMAAQIKLRTGERISIIYSLQEQTKGFLESLVLC